MKKIAYLVGPFIGDLRWEYYYFVPYIIHLMKKEPNRAFIIFTRRHRFDLYGSYAEIFVSLKIKNDSPKRHNKFKIDGFNVREFDMLRKAFMDKYKTRYKIIDEIYPDISKFLYKLKWQYPRSEMDYNFQPRKANKKLISMFVKSSYAFIDQSEYVPHMNFSNYETVNLNDLIAQITSYIDGIKITTIGCFIEALKSSQFVVGNLESDVSRLALLLGKPLITLNEKLTDDEIHLINPRNTLVIRCDNVKDGLKIYEDHYK